MTKPHRDIVAFYSRDWNGKLDVHTGEIEEDGTRGFCITLKGDYVVHKETVLEFAWVEHGDHPVKLSPVDTQVMQN